MCFRITYDFILQVFQEIRVVTGTRIEQAGLMIEMIAKVLVAGDSMIEIETAGVVTDFRKPPGVSK